MPSRTIALSSFDSRTGTSADTCESCAADGGDVEQVRPSATRDRSLIAAAETAVASRYTLCCVLAIAVVAVALLGISGTMWYRYVVRPNMLLASTGAARSQEEQPKILVVVVEATEGASTVATRPAFVGSNHASEANAKIATGLSSHLAGVTAQPQAASTEDPLPAPL